MELRQYADVIRRRWLLIAAIVVLTILFSGGMLVLRKTTYTSVVRFAVRQDPIPPTTGDYTYDRYYNWLGSEFLVDDYTLIVPSEAFATEVVTQMQKLNNWNADLTPNVVASVISADRKNRVLNVSVESTDARTAQAIIDGVAAALTEQTASGGDTDGLNGVTIHDRGLFALLDKTPQAAANNGKSLANAGVTVVVGLAIALALAFLVEFLDNSLRDPADAERVLGLPVLGAIPTTK